ncbi:MAG: DNA topoisomerase (ATP-hydrolyzing) [Myxococcota bacterium]
MTTTDVVERVPLHDALNDRYLTYALSVIKTRALPDVRDGLKPVQRRILFGMHRDLGLKPDGRYTKCAAVVGEVMKRYHPHGDGAIYDALVRMAQDFSLRNPLIDGQGNFGSLDGDPPAAMRYTECKLRNLAVELLEEIGSQTVDWRPNYDGQQMEPEVLPAQFPSLLALGVEGIAVGMATRIPPHNLGECVDAAVSLIDDPDQTVADLLEHIQGPDFPTAGRILADRADLIKVYETGQGTLRVRATWEVEKGRPRKVIITSIPYSQNKAKLVEAIGEQVAKRKLPQVVDVRDESTEDVRIVLELKSGASPEAAMAYLFKRTNLESTWPVNLTALIPSDGPGSPLLPDRLDLHQILRHFLDFRFETVRRRFTFELEKLRTRIHILEGFEALFSDLDKALALIRSSDSRRDAADKLMAHFEISDEQASAILELQLYRLAKMQMAETQEELAQKRKEAAKKERILKSPKRLWGEVRKELVEIRKIYGEPRKTVIGFPKKRLEFDEDAYIVKEDTYVVVTRDGRIKRQSSFTTLDKIRVREGDEIGWLFLANTATTLTFFTTHGSAYVMRVDGIQSTTGYGDPLSALFSLDDGERIVGVVSHDPRHRNEDQEDRRLATDDDPAPPHGVATTLQGRVLRFAMKPHFETSTKAGRRYARLNDEDRVIGVELVQQAGQRVALATRRGRVAVYPVEEVPVLKAAGKGSAGIKLIGEDHVIAFMLVSDRNEGPTVLTPQGRQVHVTEREQGLHTHGSRGRVVLKRGQMRDWVPATVLAARDPDAEDDDPEVA